MNQIPTAEDFLSTELKKTGIGMLPDILRKFARLHCEAQAKEIAEKATIDDIGSPNCDGEWMSCNIIDKESILTAYPLENIK
jgi:hypothetical protein